MGASAMLLRCAPGAEHGSAPWASAGRSSVWRKDEKRFMGGVDFFCSVPGTGMWYPRHFIQNV